MALVLIPTTYRQFTRKESQRECTGETVGQVMRELVSVYPEMKQRIFDESGKFTSIILVKGTAKGNPHQFDAVSGGTVTSKGFEAMLLDNLGSYEKFLKSSK